VVLLEDTKSLPREETESREVSKLWWRYLKRSW